MFLVFLLRLPPSGKKGEQIRGEQETCSHHQLWILWSCRIDVSKFGRYVVSPFPASVVQSHTWILLYIRPTRPSDRSISLFDKNIIHITTVRSYTLKGKQIGIFFFSNDVLCVAACARPTSHFQRSTKGNEGNSISFFVVVESSVNHAQMRLVCPPCPYISTRHTPSTLKLLSLSLSLFIRFDSFVPISKVLYSIKD